MKYTSGISWLTRTAVNPKVRWYWAIMPRIAFLRTGSWPVVGSSKSTIWGSVTSALARATRFCMPPEISEGYLWTASASSICSSRAITRRRISARPRFVVSSRGRATFS